MKAVLRRETRHCGNGATLLCWELRTADGEMIDDRLATAPTLLGSDIYFVTAEDVARLDTATAVTQLADIERGKALTLYRIAKADCLVGAGIPRG